MHRSVPVASEHEEQVTLFRWAALMAAKHPELRLMFAVPNAGLRKPQYAVKMRAEGLRAGVPDIFLPVARGGSHGMFVEMKRVRGGRVSEEQKEWMSALIAQGYRAVVCKGWEEASVAIENYLKGAIQ